MGRFLPRHFEHRLLHLFHNFLPLTEIVAKTALPNSILKLNSSFLLLFNNFMCEIKSTNTFKHLWLNVLNHLWEKQPSKTCFATCFGSVGNVLIILLCRRQDPWRTLLEELLVSLQVYCCEFMCRCFLMCSDTFGESFFRQLRLTTASLRKDC